MATTCFFEKTITDKEAKEVSMELEFGRSSYYDGENLMYFRFGDTSMILDDKTGLELYSAMKNLAKYLGYEKA